MNGHLDRAFDAMGRLLGEAKVNANDEDVGHRLAAWIQLRALGECVTVLEVTLQNSFESPAPPAAPPVKKANGNGRQDGRSLRFKCPTCGKRFWNLLGVEVHIGRVHKGSVVEPKAE